MSLDITASRQAAADRIAEMPARVRDLVKLTDRTVGLAPVVETSQEVFSFLFDFYYITLGRIDTSAKGLWRFYIGNSLVGCYIECPAPEGVVTNHRAVIDGWQKRYVKLPLW